LRKVSATINVIAWSGFWAFGYLAVSTDAYSETQLVTASLLAALGLITGIIAYLRLTQSADGSGYVKTTKQLNAAAQNRAQEQGSI